MGKTNERLHRHKKGLDTSSRVIISVESGYTTKTSGNYFYRVPLLNVFFCDFQAVVEN